MLTSIKIFPSLDPGHISYQVKMFNSDEKKRAIEALKAAIAAYESAFKQVTRKAEELYQLRCRSAEQVIQDCEDYINTLANSPKEFDKSVANFKAEYHHFTKVAQEIEIEARKHEQVSGSVVGAGVVTGTGVAVLAPGAAMAIATTFGTASTGVAISTLSGAAATNAALAWLGGGALAAGGGGMAAGSGLLALAGPIGWTIGGVALAGGALWTHQKNAEITEKATTERGKVKTETTKLLDIEQKVDRLVKLTQQHTDGISQQLKTLIDHAPKDYQQFVQEQKEILAALINNLQALSKLLNQTIE